MLETWHESMNCGNYDWLMCSRLSLQHVFYVVQQLVLMRLNVVKILSVLAMWCIQHSLMLATSIYHRRILLQQLLMQQRKVTKPEYLVLFYVVVSLCVSLTTKLEYLILVLALKVESLVFVLDQILGPGHGLESSDLVNMHGLVGLCSVVNM